MPEQSTRAAFRERCTYANVLVTYSIPVLLCWCVCLYCGITSGLDFLSETKYKTEAPAGAPSVRAKDVVVPNFPQKLHTYPFSQAVLIVAKEPNVASVQSAAAADLTAHILNGTLHACDSLPGCSTKRCRGQCWWRSASGLFVPGTPADAEEADYLSPDKSTASLIVLRNNAGFGPAGNHPQVAAWERLQQTFEDWQASHPLGHLFDIGTTHEQMLLDDAQNGIVADFEHGDMATLPIAMVILLWACGPPALLALITLPVTLLSAFWVLSQIATGAWLCTEGHFDGKCPGTPLVYFPSFGPAININMMIALSLDYTLFVLTRYQEELRRGLPNLSALANTMQHIGHVIVVSGATLGLSFGGLLFSSVDVIAALGWGGVVSVFFTVVVHLTLLPSLLFLLGACCRPLVTREWSAPLQRRLRRMWDARSTPTTLLIPLDAALSSRSAFVDAPVNVSRWVRLGEGCRDHKLKVLLGFALLLIPCGILTSQVEFSTAQAQLTPRDSTALKVMQSIADNGISAGLLDPVLVVTYNRAAPSPVLGCSDDNVDLRQMIEGLNDPRLRAIPPELYRCDLLEGVLHICNASRAPEIDDHGCKRPITPIVREFCPGTCRNYCDSWKANRSVLAEGLFEQTHALRTELVIRLGLQPREIRDIASLPSSNTTRLLSTREALSLIESGDPAYTAQFARLANFNRSAAFIEIMLPHGQSGDGGLAAVRKIRKIVDSPPFRGSEYGFEVYGDVPMLLDAVHEVESESPAILSTVSAIAIFVVSGLAFRSLLIPLRLIVTIITTLAIVVAASALVFQYAQGLDGIFWMVPLACGCLIVGLTIDYDVFLIARVYEYRTAGYTTEASILRAMKSQSGTITTAGVIMTVAFSSLLLSSTSVLNQFGFMLVIATLCDTFFVRTTLVPALMFCAVEANWWPGRMPEAHMADYTEERKPADLPTESGRTDGEDQWRIGSVNSGFPRPLEAC